MKMKKEANIIMSEKNDKMMYDRLTGSWRKVKYDKVAKLWYARHNGQRYDYYCPHCHVEYYPDAEDGIVAYDYEKKRPITEKELNENDLKAIEYGGCLYCNNNPAYMVMEKEDDCLNE